MGTGEEFVAAIAKAPAVVTLGKLIDAYLEDYNVQEFRSKNTAKGRVAHLLQFFGDTCRPEEVTICVCGNPLSFIGRVFVRWIMLLPTQWQFVKAICKVTSSGQFNSGR